MIGGPRFFSSGSQTWIKNCLIYSNSTYWSNWLRRSTLCDVIRSARIRVIVKKVLFLLKLWLQCKYFPVCFKKFFKTFLGRNRIRSLEAFCKKVFWSISQKSLESIGIGVYVIFIKKEAPVEMCSCEFCTIFENTLFTEHLRTTASEEKLILQNKLHELLLLPVLTLEVVTRSCSVKRCS